MVCCGATIIKPSLEKQQKRYLIAFGITYFIFSWFYQFVQVLRYTPQTEYPYTYNDASKLTLQ
jgi:hypothetical protein